MNSRANTALALAAAAFLVPCATADTLTVASSKDNTLYGASSTGQLSDGAGVTMICGRTSTGDTHRAVVAFDLSSIPVGSTINSVTITLHLAKTSSTAQNVSLNRLLKNWGEGTSNAGGSPGQGAPSTPGDATWVHTFYSTQFWTTPGGDFVSAASATRSVAGVASYTWASTAQLVADVQGWVNTPSTNFGWLLKGNEATTHTSKAFDTRESLTVSFRPTISVNYTPGVLCPGDANLDHKVDTVDLGILLAHFGTAVTPNTQGDMNGDGVVNTTDLGILLANFGKVC